MSRRTTVLLDDDIYEKIVSESMRKYKTTKAISKVADELLKRALKGEKVLDLIFTEKLAKTNRKEFESFRRELSQRFES